MKNAVIRRKLHNDERGAAMIVVVCVLMVTMIICLTLIVGAYQMFASVSDEGRDVSNYYQAMSFSELMKKKIECSNKPVPAVSGALTMEDYILAYAGADNYTDGENAIEGGPSVELMVNNMPTDMAGYGKLHMLIRKTKLSDTKCSMFITVMTMEGADAAKPEGYDVSSVTAGYDVTLKDDLVLGKTADIVFKGYYE